MKLCKSCKTEQPEENFGFSATVNGKTYRRHQCHSYQQARQNKRRQETSTWVAEFNKTLYRVRCGSADYRALKLRHLDPREAVRR
ncbi:hypothetical protein H6F56_00745 [Microcoleus sp. FACHB-672]|nr:hypothetical protein [Microcoleus sp. FACHB-672]